MYKYIHTCIYIHISCPHTYTHTHIYTHAYKMYIWTHAKHVWNNGTSATAREAQLVSRSSALLPVRCNPEGDFLRGQHPNRHIRLSAVYRFILIIALSTSAKGAIRENKKCITCTSSLTRSVTTHHQAILYIIFITHEQFFLCWKPDGANRKKQNTLHASYTTSSAHIMLKITH